MKTKIVEAISKQLQGAGNWGKFLVARHDVEWQRHPSAPGTDACEMSLLRSIGWGVNHVWVLDLQTCEGAGFRPGGSARHDLQKHQIWVCPLFEPFLEWLYRQDLQDLDALPDAVELDFPTVEIAGYRRPGMHR